MRKIFGWIISIAGLGGYLVNKANWIANRLSFLSLPGDLREALIEMSHIPTLISISLLIVGVTGIIFLVYDYGLATHVSGWIQRRMARGIVPVPMTKHLVAALHPIKPFLPGVAIAYTNGNANTEQYAYALRDAFHRAGIQTNFGFTIPDGPDDTGVLICIKNPEHPPPEAEILKAALKQAGIETKRRPFTQDGMHVSGEMVLWVAPKQL